MMLRVWTLGAIEVQMAWPHDLGWQRRAYTAIVAEHMKGQLDQIPSEDYRALYSLASDAPPIADVRTEFAAQCKRAFLVGQLLHDLVGGISLGIADVTMSKLILRIIEPYKKKKDGGELHISLKSFQNKIWPEFRGVAHYWAASFKAREFGSQPFPCHPAKLREFLADAEAYRIAGETSRTKQAPSTILDSAETMKLPPGVAVKPTVFHFEPNDGP